MAEGDAKITAETPPYFAVSLFKLTVMSVCTLGLYQLWWFYKHWCRIRWRERSSIWPAWRAVFAIIWCYPCLRRIRSTALELSLPVTLPAGPLTIALIITALLSGAPGAWSFLSLLSVVWLLPAQAAANRINLTVVPDHNPNGSFTGWNITAVVVGGLLLTLAVIGGVLRPN